MSKPKKDVKDLTPAEALAKAWAIAKTKEEPKSSPSSDRSE